ncbi:hypothetical protein ABT364_18745 [Massilia sp. SR12]
MRLTELEDRALAMTEGEFIEFATGRAILESWFVKSIPNSELRAVFDRLSQLGLVECKLGDSWPFSNAVPGVALIDKTSFRATAAGELYLQENKAT